MTFNLFYKNKKRKVKPIGFATLKDAVGTKILGIKLKIVDDKDNKINGKTIIRETNIIKF